MRDATYDGSLGPDATRARPAAQRYGPTPIRYASNGATSTVASWTEPAPEAEAGFQPELAPPADPEATAGWFGRRHPDLWVFGGATIVATAAMVVAFAAASGAVATGYGQTPRATTTQAPVPPPAKLAPAEKAQPRKTPPQKAPPLKAQRLQVPLEKAPATGAKAAGAKTAATTCPRCVTLIPTVASR